MYSLYIYVFAASEGMYHTSLKYKVAKSDSHQSQLHRGNHFYMAGEWTMNKHAFHILNICLHCFQPAIALTKGITTSSCLLLQKPAESTLDPVMGPPLLMEAFWERNTLPSHLCRFMAICFWLSRRCNISKIYHIIQHISCGLVESPFPISQPMHPRFSYAAQQFTKTSEPFNDRMYWFYWLSIIIMIG